MSEEGDLYERILVPVDGSPTAARGLQEAIALATRLGSTLQLLNVVDARSLIAALGVYAPQPALLDDWRAGGEKLIADAVAQAAASGVAAQGAVRCDPGLRVCDLILKETRDSGVGLVVMGTHGRRGLSRLTMGSDAEMVLRECPVPVLLVRAPPEPAAPA
jgi:nucleotide-binding universal stress UspA family protein